MQQRIITTPDAASFLGLVPAVVGMQPVESLVLVLFSGNRTCGALRLDLPHLAGDVALKRFTNTVKGMMCRVAGADGVVPIAYTEAPFSAAPRRLLARLAGRARLAGLDVKDLLVVAGNGWASLFDPAAPPGGHPLDRIVPAVIPEAADLLDPAAAVLLPAVPAPAVAAFRRHLADWVRRVDGTGAALHGVHPARAALDDSGDPFVDRVAAGLDVGPLIEAMLEPHPPGRLCPCLALLAAMVEKPVLRDLVMLQFAWGPEFGAHVRERTLLHDGGPLRPDEPVTLAFGGGDMPRPDVRRVVRGIEVVLLAAAHLDAGRRAPLLATAAWLHWTLGHGSIAGSFADLAAAADPGYPFAALLQRLLGTGALPEWAFRPEPLGEPGRRWLLRPA